MKTIKIALIGNPNCGKTTIFNHLTGHRSKIANYPGVTIEKKLGFKTIKDLKLEIVDLPGIYSLKAHSEDEKIARNYILEEKPDVVINVLDASNLEKSLFLTTQLMELGRPVLLGLNMIDIAEQRDLKIDFEFLKNILEIDLVKIIANKKKGIEELAQKAIDVSLKKTSYGININFDHLIEKNIKIIEKLISLKFQNNFKKDPQQKRLFALKLLEDDSDFEKKINSNSINLKVKEIRDNLEDNFKEHIEIVISNKRHEFIKSLLKKVFLKEVEYKKTRSDKIDEVLTHKIFGFPIFLFIMFLIFQMTFFLGSYPTKALEYFFKIITTFFSNIWPVHSYQMLRSLIIDGIITGVGSVLVFMPNIVILFFSISILEDSGYMARAAFILDRIMHKIGLHGKSFIPMLIGFGCSVPAIMATRFIESKKDRYVTILTLPLIACSAKLVVFTLFVPVFFDKIYQPLVLFSLYLIGIVLAIFLIKIFKISFFKKENFSFVMELPSYKLPSFFSLFSHMWYRSKEYIKKAGTLILGFSIVLWTFSYFPENKKDISETYIGKIGKAMEPALKPIGFDWKIDAALISSFASKEVFISQLGIIYAIKDTKDVNQLQYRLKKDYSKLQAYCILLFILISIPCIATIAITKKETNSYKWALFQFVYLTILAYIITFIVYQVGLFFTR